MTRIGRKIIMAGATALVLTAGASAATAAVMSSGPVDGSGVIHGCYTNRALNGSHVFVLQDAGTSCPRGTTAISWNQQGPAASSRMDGGVITFTANLTNANLNTCTVVQSFGPDAVTVTPAVLPIPGDNYGGCQISGLPANANIQATPVNNVGQFPAFTVGIQVQSPSSIDVIATSLGTEGGSIEFSWLAVPTS